MGASFNLADMANAAISSAVARMVANTPAPRPTPAPNPAAAPVTPTAPQLGTPPLAPQLGTPPLAPTTSTPSSINQSLLAYYTEQAASGRSNWIYSSAEYAKRNGLHIDDLVSVMRTDPLGWETNSTSGGWKHVTADYLSSLLGIPAFASGGSHEGGWALVGEEGPELANIGASRIYNARDTQQMFGGGNEELIVELRRLNERIVELEQSMKASLYPIARNTKDTSEKIVKWDGDGMPAVRT